MSYGLERNETITEGLRRIAAEQIGKALNEIDNEDIDRHATVHTVRKRCKKLRGLARLARPGLADYKKLNRFYRDAARDLSDIRDAHAVVETVDNILDHFKDSIDRAAVGGIRKRLIEQRDEINADTTSIERRISRFRDTMVLGKSRLASWTIDEDEISAVATGVAKTFRRARNARDEAAGSPTTDEFHDWRKRMKYHWYHARLLSSCWPRLIKPWADEAHHVSDLLGDEHDLAVLHARLLKGLNGYADQSTLQVLTGLIERWRAERRVRAFRRGAFMLFEKPGQLEQRIKLYLDVWKQPSDTLTAQAPIDTGY